MVKRKRQFIAGAVCPQCSDIDSLVLYSDDQSIACVSCHYQKNSEQRDAKQEKQTSAIKKKTKTYKNSSSIDITNLS